jgi:hypothetical protein
MANEYITWAWRQDLPATCKIVLVAIADRADHCGHCWPSQADIARMAGQSKRSVINQINKLIELGYLSVQERRRKDGYKAANSYQINAVSGEQFSGEQHSREQFSGETHSPSQVNTVHGNNIEPTDEPTEKKYSKKSSADVDEAVELYNATASELGLPACQKITKARRSSLANRLKDCGGLDGWREALSRMRESPFLLGHNDRGWKADIDFLCRESRFTKLMEGGYSDSKQGGKPEDELAKFLGRQQNRGTGQGDNLRL